MPPTAPPNPTVWTDETGRTWSTRVTVNTIRRVRDRLPDVDLLDVFSGRLLARLADDPIALVNTLYVVCEPQAQERGVTDEAFGELLVGDTIAEAAAALVQGICDFFPRDRRAVLNQLWAKTQQTNQQTVAMVTRKINSPLVSEAIARMIESESDKIDQRLRDFGNTSSSSPVSAESTPDR